MFEVTMFEGRSVATKKAFYDAMFGALEAELALTAQDLEIVLVETPRHDWGIRGLPGDELTLTYRVET